MRREKAKRRQGAGGEGTIDDVDGVDVKVVLVGRKREGVPAALR